MKATTTSLPFWVLAAASYSLAEAHSDGSILGRHHRGYNFHRPSYDLVTELLRAPVGWNSMFEQQKQQWSRLSRTSTPRYSIRDNNDHMTLEVEVPGITNRDLTVEVEDGQILRIKGVRQRGESPDSFSMSFNLAKNVDADKMEVTLLNGILEVLVPKRDPVIRRIEVTPASTKTEGLAEKLPIANGNGEKLTKVDGMEITED